jgi:hypothetical protein
MSTTWTLTAQQICVDALEIVGAVGAGETASAEDMSKALRALDSVLKSLPLHGYHWPKLSGEVALTWAALTPSVIAAPADYYGYPLVWKTANGQKVPLKEIPHGDWVNMTNRTATGEPTHFYITPAKEITFYPVPTVDPVAYLQYQVLVDDSVAALTPDLAPYWVGPLGWGVADEIGLAFGLDQPTRVEIAQRWKGKMDFALASSISTAPISFSVDG